MKHNLSLYKDIARQLTACGGYSLLFLAILSIYHSNYIHPLYFMGIPAILAVFLLIERYCYQILLYIVLHGICFLPFLLIRGMDSYYRILYLILLGVECARALYIWAKGTDRPYNDVPWPLLLFATICYLTAHFYRLPALKAGAYYIGVITLLIHFIRFYITGLNNLMSRSKQVTSMPTKRIMSTNLWLFGAFIIIFCILTGCNTLFGFEEIFYVFGRFLVKCIRALIQILLVIVGLLRALKAKETTAEFMDVPLERLEESVAEMTEPSLLAQVFSGLFVISFVLLLLLLFYHVMSELIKKYLSRHAKDTDIVTPIKKETGAAKKIKPNNSRLSRLRQRFAKTYEERIRQAYRLKILSYKKVELDPSDTAQDIAGKVNHIYAENIDPLTKVYEKARYSDEPVTPDEARKGGMIC